jgi:hypothetical protein
VSRVARLLRAPILSLWRAFLVAALLEMLLAFLRCSLLRCPPRFGLVALATAFNPGHPLAVAV